MKGIFFIIDAAVGQWYSSSLENYLPSGFPGSIPGGGVLFNLSLLVSKLSSALHEMYFF